MAIRWPPCSWSSATKRLDLGRDHPPRGRVVAQREVLERAAGPGSESTPPPAGRRATAPRGLAVGVAPASRRRPGRCSRRPRERRPGRPFRAGALERRAHRRPLAVTSARTSTISPRRATASGAAAPDRGGERARPRAASRPRPRARRSAGRPRARSARRASSPTSAPRPCPAAVCRRLAGVAGPRADRGARGRCRRAAAAGPRGRRRRRGRGEVDVARSPRARRRAPRRAPHRPPRGIEHRVPDDRCCSSGTRSRKSASGMPLPRAQGGVPADEAELAAAWQRCRGAERR